MVRLSRHRQPLLGRRWLAGLALVVLGAVVGVAVNGLVGGGIAMLGIAAFAIRHES